MRSATGSRVLESSDPGAPLACDRLSTSASVAVVRQAARYEPDLIRASLSEAMSLLRVDWADFVRPGDRVLIKPNLICEGRPSRPHEWEQIITHPTVIAAVARSVAAALGGRGEIVIADAPQTDSSFEKILERGQLLRLAAELRAGFPGIGISVVDLRREVWVVRGGVVTEREKMPDAPGGYTCVDLGRHSSFSEDRASYYGADYDTAFTRRHHAGGRHEYLLSRLAMDADVFVNLPKLKTHKKVGVTLSLKNLVGINGDKNYLPHFKMGTPSQGGDEFSDNRLSSRIQSRALASLKQALVRFPAAGAIVGPIVRDAGRAVFGSTDHVVRSGNWHGNDTAWRMVLDLNKILFHFTGGGLRRGKPLRYLSIVDGIIGGEGNGPAEADPVSSGVLVAGSNPVAVDMIAATLMGFDWRRLPMIREGFAEGELPLAPFKQEEVVALPGLGPRSSFRPHFGWLGHIEAR